MATTALNTDFIDIIASEMSSGVERAVERWLAQVEQILANEGNTSSEKLAAIQNVLQNYKRITGKAQMALARHQ